jgi:hypothetical protein
MATASYYDAIGLLAICDAIESSEGIPLTSFKDPNKRPAGTDPEPDGSGGPPYKYPPDPPKTYNDQNGQVRHGYLAHSPASLVSSPSGQYSYAKQRTQGHDSGIPPNLLPRQAGQPTGTVLARGTGGTVDLQSASLTGARIPGYGTPGSGATTAASTPLQTPVRPATSRSLPLTPASGGSTASPGAVKSEDCPICGRNFKGPKASTHKQQHIRRLHPESYIPKRGGKKRTLPDGSSPGGSDSGSGGRSYVPVAPQPGMTY